MSNSWQENVYGKAEIEKYAALIGNQENDEWVSIRRRAIRRDRQKCRRCDKKIAYDSLTVHHIKPRASGGSDDLANLISLCSKCHEYVECAIPPLTTREEIEASNIVIVEIPIKKTHWQTVVYGGVRNATTIPVRK